MLIEEEEETKGHHAFRFKVIKSQLQVKPQSKVNFEPQSKVNSTTNLETQTDNGFQKFKNEKQDTQA